ncbi:MAG: UDP-3-O-(3-hydroxymyristoyl)glucosamine N-acyltransferase [Cyclobacteriaceae bacterium]
MQLSVTQVASLLDGAVEGDENAIVNTISPLDEAAQGAITFFHNPKYEHLLYASQASVIIISKDFKPKQTLTPTLIRVNDPYLSFTLLLGEYQKLTALKKEGIEQPSFISATASIGRQPYVGAFAYIGDNVTIGNNTKIYPHAYIGDNSTIGDHSIVRSGVKIYEDSVIGNYCIIHSGAIIGSDGFGFAPQVDGSYAKTPQIGKVIIEDHVEIGANTVVDCATFDATIIKEGVKLDNLIQVAHNVEIGKHTVIAAQVGIAGSTKIGNNCVIGGQAGIAGHISIADSTKIQAQSGVAKAQKPGQILYGSPAIDYGQYLRSYTVFKRLPDMLKRIEELEEKVLNLDT